MRVIQLKQGEEERAGGSEGRKSITSPNGELSSRELFLIPSGSGWETNSLPLRARTEHVFPFLGQFVSQQSGARVSRKAGLEQPRGELNSGAAPVAGGHPAGPLSPWWLMPARPGGQGSLGGRATAPNSHRAGTRGGRAPESPSCPSRGCSKRSRFPDDLQK